MNFIIGQKLVKKKEFGKALNIFLSLLSNNDKDKRVYFYLGLINYELNNFKESKFYYEKFLKGDPNSRNTLLNLAIVEQSVGNLELAKKNYLKLINLDKYKIRPYYGLLILDINFLTNEFFENIIQIIKNKETNNYEKSLANFILSKKEKKKKNYKKEIKYLEIFNSNSFNSNFEYNKASQFYYKNIINKFYDNIEFIVGKNNNAEVTDLSPIFIIGLPRSGSTLVESILTSSSEKIKSCAESNIINMSILEQIASKIYIKDFNIENFIFQIKKDELKKSILMRYTKFNVINKSSNPLFIDKSLENFFNIEMILKIFPKAKFLHTFRDPVDSAISIYQSMLSELSWTHTFENILSYIDDYKKIINYFKIKYPTKIMDINLEKFTQQSEITAKSIYEFCDLKWNKKYLEFFERKDLYSKTNSFLQIRKKISEYDFEKYKPYISLLEPYKKKYKWLNKD
tara:strand:- start:133 stop:1503 length:1371 start_codon:yes stop_codon:yes gene_type:complete